MSTGEQAATVNKPYLLHLLKEGRGILKNGAHKPFSRLTLEVDIGLQTRANACCGLVLRTV